MPDLSTTITHDIGSAIYTAEAEPQYTNHPLFLCDGFALRQFIFAPGEVVGQSFRHLFVIFLDSPGLSEWQIGGSRRTQAILSAQDIFLLPAHSPYAARWKGTKKAVEMFLEPCFLTRAVQAHPDDGSLELHDSGRMEDPLIRQFGLTLHQTARNWGTIDPLYGETLATALAVHLLQHYAPKKPHLPTSAERLAQLLQRRAIDYIHTHLAEEITLAQLAALTNLSPHHFARQFKQAIGLAPHQYLIHARVERAKELLAHTTYPGEVIAAMVGFVDQSHLARHFKRIVGVPPKAFRQQCQHSPVYIVS
jgi:AraC family transcriptional regulator